LKKLIWNWFHQNNGWWCWGRTHTFTSEENNEEEQNENESKKMILLKWVLCISAVDAMDDPEN
jgi:hypothetical protein